MMSAVAGATSINWAFSVSPMCWGSEELGRSQVLVRTGRPDSAWNVSAPTNFVADSVITTVTPTPCWTSLETTSATLYEAMPPQTAMMISRSLIGCSGADDMG